jgi:hypothetical protein
MPIIKPGDLDIPEFAIDYNLDSEHNTQRLVYEKFCEGGQLMEEIEHLEHNKLEEETTADIITQLDMLDKIFSHAFQSIYKNSKVSIVLETIVLIKMAVLHEISNAYMDKLLTKY